VGGWIGLANLDSQAVRRWYGNGRALWAMVTTRVTPVRESGARRGKRERVTCHVAERSHSGLARMPTARGKGNLSHANFVTLLPPLLLFERNREQGGREEGDDAWVPLLGGCGKGGSLLGQPMRGQA
jgi:hypothetical protein